MKPETPAGLCATAAAAAAAGTAKDSGVLSRHVAEVKQKPAPHVVVALRAKYPTSAAGATTHRILVVGATHLKAKTGAMNEATRAAQINDVLETIGRVAKEAQAVAVAAVGAQQTTAVFDTTLHGATAQGTTTATTPAAVVVVGTVLTGDFNTDPFDVPAEHKKKEKKRPAAGAAGATAHSTSKGNEPPPSSSSSSLPDAKKTKTDQGEGGDSDRSCVSSAPPAPAAGAEEELVVKALAVPAVLSWRGGALQSAYPLPECEASDNDDNDDCKEGDGAGGAGAGGEAEVAAVPFTTWKKRGELEVRHVIDYIFFEQAKFKVSSTLSAPLISELPPHRLPCLAYPSDHLSIAAELEWRA
jgi:endonuclease/exonuclease/phosphatase family metal-dependent hydrolase